MITYDKNSIVEMAVRFIGKPCVYIDNNLEYNEEDNIVWGFIVKEFIRLYSPNDTHTPKYFDVANSALHGGLIAFDTEAEQKEFYSIFTSKEVYGSGIYAVAFDEDGNAMDENT